MSHLTRLNKTDTTAGAGINIKKIKNAGNTNIRMVFLSLNILSINFSPDHFDFFIINIFLISINKGLIPNPLFTESFLFLILIIDSTQHLLRC